MIEKLIYVCITDIIIMRRFKVDGRYSDIVTAKIRPKQRDFLEERALAREISLCDVIRELIDQEMSRAANSSA